MEYKHRALETLTEEIFRTSKCVLVTGARQTGKSTMLQKLFPDLTYVTLDDDFVKDKANENPRFFMEMNPPPAIIDEIQKAPALFPLVKIRCDQSPRKGLFCLSGSQPFTLMQSAFFTGNQSGCIQSTVCPDNGLFQSAQRFGCQAGKPVEYDPSRRVSGSSG